MYVKSAKSLAYADKERNVSLIVAQMHLVSRVLILIYSKPEGKEAVEQASIKKRKKKKRRQKEEKRKEDMLISKSEFLLRRRFTVARQ